MKKINVFKLRSIVKDTATGKSGMITHSIHFPDGSVRYLFQPTGLDNETREPLKLISIDCTRINKSKPPQEEIEIPFEIFGTLVIDTASGYTGIATQIIRHMHGCLHVLVQSQETTKSGHPVEACEFNYIQLKGKAIPKESEEVKEKSRKDKPSPTHIPRRLLR